MKGEELGLFCDEIRNFVYVEDVARGVMMLLRKHKEGIKMRETFLLVGEKSNSRFDLGFMTRNALGINTPLKKTESLNVTDPPRPLNLSCKTGRLAHVLPDLRLTPLMSAIFLEIENVTLIKRYKHWALMVHQDQYPYAGRCVAAALREEADLLTDMNVEERNELFDLVIHDWSNALKKNFGMDRPNLTILGNTWNHLHAHLIPRYNKPFKILDFEFVDPNPTGNPSPHEKKLIPPNVLVEIVKRLRELIK